MARIWPWLSVACSTMGSSVVLPRIPRVVTLPEEIRQDRDDRGRFLIYDERFVRRHGDDYHRAQGG